LACQPHFASETSPPDSSVALHSVVVAAAAAAAAAVVVVVVADAVVVDAAIVIDVVLLPGPSASVPVVSQLVQASNPQADSSSPAADRGYSETAEWE